MKDDKVYVLHVLDCIGKIRSYTDQGKGSFLNDNKTQDAVLRNLQVLAESVKLIPQSIQQRYPEIEWQRIIAFRNVLVHAYLSIDMEEIWKIVERDLPPLQVNMEKIRAEQP